MHQRRQWLITALAVLAAAAALVAWSAVESKGTEPSTERGPWVFYPSDTPEIGYLLNTQTGELWDVRQNWKILVEPRKDTRKQ